MMVAHRDDIRAGQQVLGADGGMIGRVIRVHEHHLIVEPSVPAPDAPDHSLPLDWVARVEAYVHLNVPDATARERWGSVEEPALAPEPAPSEGRKSNWLPWLAGVVLLVAILFFGARGCSFAADSTDYQGNAADLNGALADIENGAGPTNGQ